MFVSTYNNNGLNDVLMIMFKKSRPASQTFTEKENLVEIVEKDSDEIVGYNLFNASEYLSDLENGATLLSDENIKIVNSMIEKAGFEKKLNEHQDNKFVVGYVKSCEPVEGSDHLNITQTEVENGETLQIVCGASNIAEGQKVVVAEVGAVMPNGLVIWPGELKGVKSEGMICSARELGLKQESEGIMVLEDNAEAGSVYSF